MRAERLCPRWYFLTACLAVSRCFLQQVGIVEASAGVSEKLSPAFRICIPPARAKAHVSPRDASLEFTRPNTGTPLLIQSDINCSVDLRSTTAVGDRRYSRMRHHLCRSV